MKKRYKIALVVFVLVGAIFIGSYSYLKSSLNQLVTMQVEDMDISSLKDGSYIGEYIVVPVSVKVQVDISGGEIVDILILDHGNGQGKPAEIITEDIISAQSLSVDSISGATYSSRVIVKGIEDALKKAK